MHVSRREAVAWMSTAASAAAAASNAAGSAAVIRGVDHYRVVEPVFEGVRVILTKRGERYSPAYIQGISGAAFRIAGPCPCAPTCTCAMTLEALIRLLGYQCETIPSPKPDKDEQTWLRAALARVKDEVRANRPVLMFHAFTLAEWDVVCGFDESRKQLIGRGSYAGLRDYARADEARTLQSKPICGIVGPTLVGAKTGTFDARAAEVAALREAVRFAHSTSKQVAFPGLQCYEKWIEVYRSEPPKAPDFKRDGYPSGIYRSTQRAAAAFLREIALKNAAYSPQLRRAGGHFAREAKALDGFYAMLFAKAREPVASRTDRERNERAAALLAQARDAYRCGIDEIERALPALNT